MNRYWLCIALAIELGIASSARAQSLQRVTVASFVLSADTPQPNAGERFHLVITLRIAQRLGDVENLQLPDLSSLQVLGDERGLSSGPQGTLYRETLTVQAESGGTIAVAPATFDAVDARDGKAKQWSSNSIMIRVAGAPTSSGSALRLIVGRILLATGIGVIVLGSLMLPVLRKPPPVAPLPVEQPPLPAADSDDPLREALVLLHNDRTRGGVMRARSVLHRMVGAADGETLQDVMLRAKRTHPELTAALSAIERAAFTYDEDFESARATAETALEMAR